MSAAIQLLLLFGLTISSFVSGWLLRGIAERRAKPRMLPLPIRQQVWRVQGMGRVLVRGVSRPGWFSNGVVGVVQPMYDEQANPWIYDQWDPRIIDIPLEEFDRLATLEHR